MKAVSFLAWHVLRRHLLQKLCSVQLARNLGMGGHETNDQLRQREALEERVDSALGAAACGTAALRNGGGGAEECAGGYFCRLSTRSPKDSGTASVHGGKGTTLLERLDAKLAELRVRSGYETVELLIGSQRIFSDISNHFEYRLPGASSGCLALSLREWQHNLPQDHEFRCFVHRRRVTAISQYACYYVFEALQDVRHCEAVRDAIIRFHDGGVGEAVPMDSFVMDVAVYPDLSCKVIELNPFGAHLSCGSALFSWTLDSAILYGEDQGGRADGVPAMRVLQELRS